MIFQLILDNCVFNTLETIFFASEKFLESRAAPLFYIGHWSATFFQIPYHFYAKICEIVNERLWPKQQLSKTQTHQSTRNKVIAKYIYIYALEIEIPPKLEHQSAMHKRGTNYVSLWERFNVHLLHFWYFSKQTWNCRSCKTQSQGRVTSLRSKLQNNRVSIQNNSPCFFIAKIIFKHQNIRIFIFSNRFPNLFLHL